MIYICILNYNNASDTLACLQSIEKLRDVLYKVVLVDNASTDDSVNVLERFVNENQNIKFICAHTNGGYAAGNNIALEYAMQQKDMDYCWILNNDTLVDEYALVQLKKYMDNNPKVGICGSKLVYEWDKNKIQGYGAFYNPVLGTTSMCKDINKIGNIDYIVGAACMVRKEFLCKVGLMDEEYCLYYEELDWAYRAKGRFKIACVPESVVYHKEGASIGGNDEKKHSKSLLSDYYGLRNRILFTMKFHPCFLPTVYIGLMWSIFNRIKRKQFNRIFIICKLMLGIKDKKLESYFKVQN